MATTLTAHLRGDTWAGFILTANENDGYSTPISFTSADVVFQVRKTASRSAALLLELTTEYLGGLTIGTSGGQSAIIAAPRIVDIAAGNWAWDIQVTYPSGTVQTIASGTWEITNDVSV